jgi:predicted amidophosphoribosyltransferase
MDPAPRPPRRSARLGDGLRGLVDLVLPAECAGCGAAGSRCCPACRGQLLEGRPELWRPSPVPDGFPPTWSVLPYAGVARACIVAWKDEDRADLTSLLAHLVLRGVAAALSATPEWSGAVGRGTPVLLVPAPSSPGSTRRRGRAPVGDLTRLACGAAGERHLSALPALRLTRGVRDQAGLDRVQRRDNLSGAMGVRRRHAATVDGAVVVVVDDVVTTGATLTEAVRALSSAGARDVVAVTVAATRRRASATP